MPSDKSTILELDSVVAGYGKKQIINSVTMTVCAGEIVALIGHNGAGKSTLLKTLFGLIPIWSGRIVYRGIHISRLKPHELLRCGIAYVPQGSRVFSALTVRENLKVAGSISDDRELLAQGMERVLTLFPILQSRWRQKAGSLSGGEKQMLALANVLVLSPRVLLLDEPALGLAPSLVTEVFARIKEMNLRLGITAVIAEQKVYEILGVADRAYVLRNGVVSHSGPANLLREEGKLKEVYL